MNTTNLISTPNIEGNIGSCTVQSTSYKTSMFFRENIQVNSCSGEIVSQHSFFTFGPLWFLVAILVLIACANTTGY